MSYLAYTLTVLGGYLRSAIHHCSETQAWRTDTALNEHNHHQLSSSQERPFARSVP